MRRLSQAARRYLLTFQSEPFAYGAELSPGVFIGGRWGVRLPAAPGDSAEVHHFRTPHARDHWESANPRNRAVGKRHPLVKAFRRRASGGRVC